MTLSGIILLSFTAIVSFIPGNIYINLMGIMFVLFIDYKMIYKYFELKLKFEEALTNSLNKREFFEF